jgi:hypothetical protein
VWGQITAIYKVWDADRTGDVAAGRFQALPLDFLAPARRCPLLLVHPLWRTDGDFGKVLSAGEYVRFVDTFNLDRRPLRAPELAQEENSS